MTLISKVVKKEVKKSVAKARTMDKMKSSKVLGLDKIPVGIWKMTELKYEGISRLTKYFNLVVAVDEIHNSRKFSITIPIFKNKEDPANCYNYRLIGVLVRSLKILERLRDERIQSTVQLTVNQCNFIRGWDAKVATCLYSAG